MMYKQMLESLGYKIKDRRFSDIADIIAASKAYSGFKFLAQANNDIVYSGAEHKPADLSKKLPNLTHIPNLETIDGVVVMGCTMGHHQDMPDEKRMQELYEFYGYGAMVIDHDGENTVDFVFTRPKDKVAVPNKCHMTIYNLDNAPLNTADFASPDKNSLNWNGANKDMQKQIGPVFVIYLEGNKIVFKLSEKYVNSDNEFAVQYGSGISLVDCSSENLEIRYDVGKSNGLGERLYAELSTDETKKRFARIGVNLVPASKEVEILGVKTRESLLEIIGREDKLTQKYFGLK